MQFVPAFEWVAESDRLVAGPGNTADMESGRLTCSES